MAQKVLSAAAIANRQRPGVRYPRRRDAEHDYTRLERQPPGRGNEFIQTMGMIFMNPVPAVNMGIGDSWVISDIITSATTKGLNWQYYRDKLLEMGYPSAAFIETTLGGQPAFQVGGSPYGDAACALASLFDKVALGHWPSNNVIARIKELAAQQGRQIEIGNYFINYETINQAPQLSACDELLRGVVKGSYLIDGTAVRHLASSVDTIVNAGTGYVTGDTILLAGGTGINTRTKLTVTASGGVITAATITNHGSYTTAAPADPVAQFSTSGGGVNATFNMTYISCLKVDQFELSDGSRDCPNNDAASGSTHTWYANCADLSGAEAATLHGALSAILGAHYTPDNRPGFVIVDNALDSPNWGTATNEPTVSGATFTAYYKLFMGALVGLVPNVWANRGETTVATYSGTDIPNRYGEFFMHHNGDPSQSASKTLAALQSDLIAARDNHILIAMDHARKFGEVDLWATSTGPGGSKGTWAELKSFMGANGLRNNMIAIALRTSTGFYGHWQTEFGEI